MNDWMDVGAFARTDEKSEATEEVLYLRKHHVTPRTKQIRIVTDAKPHEVGVDPYNKLIDRNSDDNRKRVE